MQEDATLQHALKDFNGHVDIFSPTFGISHDPFSYAGPPHGPKKCIGPKLKDPLNVL